MTASEQAEAYNAEALWVPCERCDPPENETVKVLFADGIAVHCKRAGRMYLMQPSGMYRYVEAIFWQPMQ